MKAFFASMFVSGLLLGGVLAVAEKATEAPPAPPSTWYVEVLRGGEHVSTFVAKEKPDFWNDGHECRFTTIEGQRITTTAHVLIKERKAAPSTVVPAFKPEPASKF
jgi:hypothetical protein